MFSSGTHTDVQWRLHCVTFRISIVSLFTQWRRQGREKLVGDSKTFLLSPFYSIPFTFFSHSFSFCFLFSLFYLLSPNLATGLGQRCKLPQLSLDRALAAKAFFVYFRNGKRSVGSDFIFCFVFAHVRTQE